VAALQHLPPRQRVVLVLRDALGFPATEVADMLETSEAAVKVPWQRARATLKTRLPARDRERAPLPRSPRERELVGRFADAVESDDVDGVATLLTDDAWRTMPPQPFEYQGHAAIASFLHNRAALRSLALRLVPTRTKARVRLLPPGPREGDRRPYGLMVLTLEGDRISAITWFGDAHLFAVSGSPELFAGSRVEADRHQRQHCCFPARRRRSRQGKNCGTQVSRPMPTRPSLRTNLSSRRVARDDTLA
jgi:Sigma-70, region 4